MKVSAMGGVGGTRRKGRDGMRRGSSRTEKGRERKQRGEFRRKKRTDTRGRVFSETASFYRQEQKLCHRLLRFNPFCL